MEYMYGSTWLQERLSFDLRYHFHYAKRHIIWKFVALQVVMILGSITVPGGSSRQSGAEERLRSSKSALQKWFHSLDIFSPVLFYCPGLLLSGIRFDPKSMMRYDCLFRLPSLKYCLYSFHFSCPRDQVSFLFLLSSLYIISFVDFLHSPSLGAGERDFHFWDSRESISVFYLFIYFFFPSPLLGFALSGVRRSSYWTRFVEFSLFHFSVFLWTKKKVFLNATLYTSQTSVGCFGVRTGTLELWRFVCVVLGSRRVLLVAFALVDEPFYTLPSEMRKLVSIECFVL